MKPPIIEFRDSPVMMDCVNDGDGDGDCMLVVLAASTSSLELLVVLVSSEESELSVDLGDSLPLLSLLKSPLGTNATPPPLPLGIDAMVVGNPARRGSDGDALGSNCPRHD